MRYVTKPVAVTVIHWEFAFDPPPCVHDVFSLPGELPAGYLSTHEGDKIMHLGEYVVCYPDGTVESMSDVDLNARFVKDE